MNQPVDRAACKHLRRDLARHTRACGVSWCGTPGPAAGAGAAHPGLRHDSARQHPYGATTCRTTDDGSNITPWKKAANSSVADSGRTCATYWSGRTNTTTPSQESSRDPKMSSPGPAAYTFSQSVNPNGPVCGMKTGGTFASSTSS